MRFFYTIIIVLLFQLPSYAQKTDSLKIASDEEETDTLPIIQPKKRLFNVGLSTGIGGLNYIFYPTFDLSIKGTMLRAVYGPTVQGGGISQQLFRLSKYSRAYWNISAYYLYSQQNGFYAQNFMENLVSTIDQYKSLGMLTGIRVYFGRHWYSHLQVGATYIKYQTYQGIVDPHSTYNLYFEFGIGFNILSSYRKTGKENAPKHNKYKDDED